MKKQSKFLSLILRHNPQAGNLTLDHEGWANVNLVLKAIRGQYGDFSRSDLEELVRTNDKQRFAFSPHGDRIRANQGHSIEVDLKLEPATPPDYLYHGTKREFLHSILREGLKPGSRQHVHLSRDVATAEVVAARRKGESVILIVHAGEMASSGGAHVFYQSANNVWLTDRVPPEFIELDQ